MFLAWKIQSNSTYRAAELADYGYSLLVSSCLRALGRLSPLDRRISVTFCLGFLSIAFRADVAEFGRIQLDIRFCRLEYNVTERVSLQLTRLPFPLRLSLRESNFCSNRE